MDKLIEVFPYVYLRKEGIVGVCINTGSPKVLVVSFQPKGAAESELYTHKFLSSESAAAHLQSLVRRVNAE